MNYVETIFPNELFLFITEEIKQNTVIDEGGYMSGIPAKNMYKSKFTGCKSIQPLIGQYFLEESFAAITAMSVSG